VKPLGIRNDGQGLDYFIPEKDHIKQEDIPVSHWMGYVGLVIGAQHATKKLPVDKLKALCQAIQYPVILLGGKEDAATAEEIRAIDDVKIYNACGKFSLNESADLVKRARLIISHDTGLMHIAAAFKKEIISVWGNTVPEFGMYPYMGFNTLKGTLAPNVHIAEVKGLSCRPCSKIGYQRCPKKHFRCMNNQDIPGIAALAHKILQ
jgi:ADP-heptose:LPS heptosyltransferase